MELLSITLAANQTRQYAKAGRYFEIIDAAASLEVDFYGASGNQTDSMLNAVSGLFLEDPYSAFSVVNGPVAQTVTLLVMETGRGGSRRQPGTVRVIDSGADKTRAGKQFMAGPTAPASVGLISVVSLQIGGSIFAIKRIVVSSSIAGGFFVGRGSAPGTATPATLAIYNKLASGANSSGAFGVGTMAAIAPTALEVPGYVTLANPKIAANAPFEIPLTTPIVLDGTATLVIFTDVVNRDISATFDIEQV